jgi:hypothetical protein
MIFMKEDMFISILIFWLVDLWAQSQKIMNDFTKLAWLEGVWKRTNVKTGAKRE